MISILLSLSCALAPAEPAAGPAVPPLIPSPVPLQQRAFPQSVTTCSASAVGRFTGNHASCAFATDAGVFLWTSPELFSDVRLLPGATTGAVSALACISIRDTDQDSLLIADHTGIHVWTLDRLGGEHGLRTVSDLVNAADLAVGDVDGDGDDDIVALGGHGSRIEVSLQGAEGAFAPGAALDLPAVGFDLDVAQWTPGGGLEIVLVSSAGFTCYDASLVPITSTAFPSDEGRIARLAEPTGDAVAVWIGSTTFSLLSWVRPNGDGDGTLSMWPHRVQSMTAAEFNADGYSDLGLTLTTDNAFCSLVHDPLGPAAFRWDDTGGFVTTLPHAPIGPAIAYDQDGDGDDETAMPLPGGDSIGYVVNPLVDANALAPDIVSVSNSEDGVTGDQIVELVARANQLPTGMSAFEVVVWAYESTGQTLDWVRPVAIRKARANVIDVGVDTTVTVPLPLPANPDSYYAVTCRLIDDEEGSDYATACPATMVTLRLQHQSTGPLAPAWWDDAYGFGGEYVPSLIPPPCPPPTNTNEDPPPNPPTVVT